MKREFKKSRSDVRPNKKCNFCVNKIEEIDYKDAPMLGKYLNRWSKIESRDKNGCCARHQRWLATAVKRARYLALLPYISR